MELSTSISPGFPLLEKDQKITGLVYAYGIMCLKLNKGVLHNYNPKHSFIEFYEKEGYTCYATSKKDYDKFKELYRKSFDAFVFIHEQKW